MPIPPKRPPLGPVLDLAKALARSFGCCLESELVFFFSACVLFVLKGGGVRVVGGYGLAEALLLNVLELLAAGSHHLVGWRGEGIVSSS